MVSHNFLGEHLSGQPVDPIKTVPCTYDHRPILAVQGTVDLRVSFAGWEMEATVYAVGNPCKPLISQDLIDGLELSIHGRGLSTGMGPTVQTLSLGTTPQLLQLGPYPMSFQHQG